MNRAKSRWYLWSMLSLISLGLGCRPAVKPPPAVPPAVPPTTAVAPPAAPSDAPWFVEATAESGVEFVYRNGREADERTILESLGGGVGVCDFDRDGWLDICLPGGGAILPERRLAGLPMGLFRNLGDWQFTDVSELASVGKSDLYTHGVAIADYNNDGFHDLLVTGYGGLQLFTNLGDGTFAEDSRSSGLIDSSWSTSAGWADFDGDGSLDLYAAHYVDWSFKNHPVCEGPRPGEREICPPKTFEGLPDIVFFSNGDGTFRNVTSEVGLDPAGKGLGVLLADVDVDGDVDVYVANDTVPNALYLNDGSGRFESVASLNGVAYNDRGAPDGSMGVDSCDFNLDSLPDLWVANYEIETFAMYRNQGSAQFLHVSQGLGMTSLDGLYVGFGTICADFDHDQDEDIVVANGHVILFPNLSPRRQLPLLLEHTGQRYRQLQAEGGQYFTTDHEGRGLAAGDLDGDGDLDLVISHLNDPVSLLRNDIATGNWFVLRLIGRESNRDAIGARVIVATSGRRLARQKKGANSYLSCSDERLFWGLGDAESVDEVTVVWPSGRRQQLTNLQPNQTITLIEPES